MNAANKQGKQNNRVNIYGTHIRLTKLMFKLKGEQQTGLMRTEDL